MYSTLTNLYKSVCAVFKPQASFMPESSRASTPPKKHMFAPAEQPGDFRNKLTTQYQSQQVVRGTVTSVRDCGVFIVLPNGESGLVPPREISWPNENKTYVKGEKVNVVVKGFRVGVGLYLSIRWANAQNAFSQFVDQISEQSIVKGSIKRIVDYGVFVTLANGVDALMHESQIPKGVSLTRENIGDEVTVQILSINKELKRISLKYVEAL
jgi:ribosomal protein S1